MSIVGRRDLALACLNRDLLSGQLGSALVQISPDSKETMTLLKPSDWRQRTVQAPWNPEEGVGVEPYVAGHYFVWRVDLDKWYPTPTMTDQSDDTPSALTSTSEHDADDTRRKPGPKIKHNWKLRLAAELHRIKEDEGRTPTAKELAQFCRDEWDYEPDVSEIQKLMKNRPQRVIPRISPHLPFHKISSATLIHAPP